MKRNAFFLATALGAVAAGLVSGNASAGVPIPPISGDFVVEIVPPGAPKPGVTPDCDPNLLTIGATLMGGAASVTAQCEYNVSGSQESSTGTVSNPSLATSTGDSGFTKGSLKLVCDFNQSVDITMSIARTGSELKSFAGTVLQACSFTMTFTDAKSSTLSGTVEVNGKLGSDDGSVSGGKIAIGIEAKAYVTSGTGTFAGYVGDGTFSQNQEIEIPSAPSGSGGSAAPSAPPSSGDGTGTGQTQAQALCAANGITDCTTPGITAWCGNGSPSADRFAVCLQFRNLVQSQSVRAFSSRVRAFATQSSMDLNLVKKAGAVRILTPAPAAGSPTAVAKVKATTKVRLAATVGATCTVKTNKGKIVGKGVSRGASLSVKPAAGSYVGAKTLQATCKAKSGQSFTSNKVKIKLG
jgi:hypothetical protein